MSAQREPKKLRLPRAMDIGRALSTSPPMPDFVLPGLPIGCVGAVVAPGATGKTMLLLQLCAALALGVPVFDEGLFDSAEPPAAPCKVVLVVAEETAELMHIRLHAVAAELARRCAGPDGALPHDIAGLLATNLRIYPLAGDLPMRLDERSENCFGVEELEAMASGARLVVLDPMRQFHRGEENGSDVMSEVVRVLQGVAYRTNCAALLAHHTNKWSTTGGQGDRAAAARGSGAFTDAVRWQMNLSELDDALAGAYRIDPDDARHHVRVDLAKTNYLPPQPPMVLRRGEAGVLAALTPARCKSRLKAGRSPKGRA